LIRNVLFDMGNVLLRFDRQLFLNRLDVTEEEKQLLLRRVFLSTEWVQMDRGTLDEPEAEARMCADLPRHLHSAVHALVSKWDEPILPIPGMYELVAELKEMGCGIYLLSNASHRQHEYWKKVTVSPLFDGTIISADEGVMKPGAEYFLRALKRFGLTSNECFFVDDMPANVEGAAFCGIPGAVFYGDAALLRSRMKDAGIPLR